MIDWTVLIESIPAFLKGLRTTMLLLVLSCGAGFFISIPLAVARVSPRPFIAKPVWLFTYVLRGTPLLVQMFMVYYGLAQFEAVRESFAWQALRDPWFCAWLVFTLNTTAYTTEIFAGALRHAFRRA